VNDPRPDAPTWTRNLAAAVQFVDPFTSLPIRAPFAVSIPALQWTALWWDADATYRFSLANVPLVAGAPKMPVGVFMLMVTPAGGPSYAALEPRLITLPVAPTHPPPVVAADYLIQLALWPTAAFRPPAGETAVTAQLISATNQSVAGLKARMFDASVPSPPSNVYTRSDANGEFLIRLPGLQRGNAANPTVVLDVQIFNAANAPIVVTPATLTVPIGQLTGFVTLGIP
jgi:hypothetical protein